MRRSRALAAAVVGAVTIGTAYANLVATPSTTAASRQVPAATPADVVFSVRNNTSSTVTITNLIAMFPNAGDIDGCSSFTITPTMATVGSGQQQQFKVDTSGLSAPGTYSCTYQVQSTPAMAPTPQVTARFTVSAAPDVGNVQPTVMDFGTQGSGTFEQQTLYATNYGSDSQMQLSITGDPSIAFGTPCDGQQVCMLGTVVTNATGTIPIKCSPKSGGSHTATVSVAGFGSASAMYGSIPVTCTSPSFGTLTISPMPVVISGPQNQQTSVPVTVTYTGSGSAVLTAASITGATFGITDCGGASCSNLSKPFTAMLSVYCTPSTGTSGTLFVSDSNGDMTSQTVSCDASGSGGPYMTVFPQPSLFLGQAPINMSTTGTVTIGNAGTSSLANIEVAVSGIDAPDFSVSPCMTGMPCSLGAGGSGGSLPVTVTFTPHGIGTRSGLLTITSNDPAHSPTTVGLDGSGQGAILTVTDPANDILDFGTIGRGQAVTRTIALYNTGNLALNATLSGYTAPYSVAMPTVPVGGPGSGTIAVTCQSNTASASNTQTLTITAPEAFTGSPHTITTQCAIASSPLAVAPNPIDFGEHRVGSPDASIDVTLTNPGSAAAPAVLHHVQLDTAKTGLSLNPADTTTMLGQGSSATVTLTLKSTTETDLTGENLDVDVDGDTLQIKVLGRVVTPGSRVAPEALDLGTACVGTQVTGSVSLINTGTATLHLANAPTMDQNFTAAFVMPTTYPSTLPAGATAVTTISPAMTATGMVTGTLDWKDDVPSEYHVPVTLEYVSSGTAISPAALDFGSVEIGSPGSSQQITIQNCEATPAQVKVRSLRATSGPIGAWRISPMIGNSAQLGAKGVETVTAHFEPPGRGRYEAELDLDTPAGISKIKLVGEATGRNLDDTSVYACSCSGGNAGGGWPIALALVLISVRRRRGSSSPR